MPSASAFEELSREAEDALAFATEGALDDLREDAPRVICRGLATAAVESAARAVLIVLASVGISLLAVVLI